MRERGAYLPDVFEEVGEVRVWVGVPDVFEEVGDVRVWVYLMCLRWVM